MVQAEPLEVTIAITGTWSTYIYYVYKLNRIYVILINSSNPSKKFVLSKKRQNTNNTQQNPTQNQRYLF